MLSKSGAASRHTSTLNQHLSVYQKNILCNENRPNQMSLTSRTDPKPQAAASYLELEPSCIPPHSHLLKGFRTVASRVVRNWLSTKSGLKLSNLPKHWLKPAVVPFQKHQVYGSQSSSPFGIYRKSWPPSSQNKTPQSLAQRHLEKSTQICGEESVWRLAFRDFLHLRNKREVVRGLGCSSSISQRLVHPSASGRNVKLPACQAASLRIGAWRW